MSDYELFEKLKREDDTWKEVYWLFQVDEDKWKLFGWLWERAKEKSWWAEYKGWISAKGVDLDFISPSRFRKTLKEYMLLSRLSEKEV